MFFARGILVLALLLSLARAVSAAEPEQPADVAELFAKMRAHLARITSIEYTSGTIGKRHIKGVLEESESELTFAYAAGKYLSKLQGKTTRNTTPFMTDRAYDGTRYYELEPNNGYLRRSSKPFYSAYGGIQLFFYPYALLVNPGSPFTVEQCLDEAAWKKVAGAALEGNKEVDGHPCQVVRFTVMHSDGKEFVRRAHVATDLEYLPILIEAQGAGKDRYFFRFSNLESFQTPAGRIVIALNAKSEGTTDAIQSEREWWINADSLKVNHAIAPERFTIPPEQVKRVYDVD